MIFFLLTGVLSSARSTLTDYDINIDLAHELQHLDGMNTARLKEARTKIQMVYNKLVAKERKYKELYSARSTARSDRT